MSKTFKKIEAEIKNTFTGNLFVPLWGLLYKIAHLLQSGVARVFETVCKVYRWSPFLQPLFTTHKYIILFIKILKSNKIEPQ